MALNELSSNVRMAIGVILFISFILFTFILRSNTPHIFYAIIGGLLGIASIYVLSHDVDIIKRRMQMFFSIILVGVGISIWDNADGNPFAYIFSIGVFLFAGYIVFREFKGSE
tara:strand:+ start:95 stop:433 length:339 start_codon:yes stop_codon:yes gene_type:complete